MAELKSTNDIVADAYIQEQSRVLDPTLLDKTVLDRMPQPTGWRMLVLPYAGKAKQRVESF